ncbi:hypothetical protein QAD02_011691 [Eretmocerus hayati]|uniref:Uncharacterized protein n=1 Tax=Eretmocerus hayati TaxID=131215 RepID=A0ACC2NXH4_9HYME|nr:hypothetical protein QAD02_011691 [Eretmocerus hayati]
MAAPTEQRQRYLIGGPISPIDDQDQTFLNGQELKSLLYHIQNDHKKLRCAAKSVNSAQNLSTRNTPTSSQGINSSQQSSSSAGYLPGGRDCENQSVRGTVNIMNADVVTALDIGGVTYRNTMRIFSAVAKVLRVPIKNLILNKTSFRGMREKIREEHSGKIMTCFGRSDSNAASSHVDGIRMLDETTHKFEERLPVVLSDGKTTKIISAASSPLMVAIVALTTSFWHCHQHPGDVISNLTMGVGCVCIM